MISSKDRLAFVARRVRRCALLHVQAAAKEKADAVALEVAANFLEEYASLPEAEAAAKLSVALVAQLVDRYEGPDDLDTLAVRVVS